ncbi:MAG: hypothetical protein A2920_01925 [Candidatus Zambryskibacteria bacterium RIFCSPLOWO2_01_FULL_43_17]|uniref:Fibronectin type-III domain-containing protein n=1 Tax=Candidatus Zambryskibacteria bacterium RIFCSPLOWO2_01_FULL_43_17 TaxID=1802760 RepID=A0A1G2U2N8_9BACT|nr:MAG: hypothetical protein A2920_01925 [Candidatus Zambryskibacteria bacterium RIFCSPLOWO2_01_FULL_43_17]
MKNPIKSNPFFNKFAPVGVFLLAIAIWSFSFVGFVNSSSLIAKIAEAANVTFNDDPADFSTVRSSNYTEFPDSTTNWADTTDADAGEIVSFTVYYHNTGDEIATNVIAQLSVPQASGTSIVASGGVSADNAQSVNGQTTINLTSEQSLTYIPGSTSWYPDQSQTPSPFPFGQTGDEFVTGQGVNIGDIASGWSSQGSVVARFQVSNNTVIPPEEPVPDPTADIKANTSDGPITLQIGEQLSISWMSTNAVACALSGGIDSGVGLSGAIDITPSHPSYPATTSSIFTITCDNGEGKTATDSVTVNPPTPPVSSLDITANGSQGPLVVSGEALTLNWISENVLTCSLAIQGGTDLGGVSPVGSAGPMSIGHPFYPTADESRVFVITCSKLNGGTISDSVEVSLLVTPEPPVAPVIISANASGTCGGVIDLQWSVVANAEYYKVFRDGALIATTTATSVSDSGLVPLSSHIYTVRAVNSVGESAYSNAMSANASGACVIPPVAPTITATTGSQCGGSILITWNTVSNASYYKITRDGAEIATTSATTYTDSGLTPGSGYAYSVKAVNSAGQSASSNTATAVASAACVEEPEVPSAPTLTATTSPVCGGSVSLSWTASTGATFYKIFRNHSQIATTTSTAYTDSDLSPNTLFTYKVKATNSVGDSMFSNSVSARSSDSCPPPASSPTVSLTANPPSINLGSSSVLSWTSTNAVSCASVWTTATSTSGAQAVSPATTTVYSITCSGAGGVASSTARVTVNLVPPPCFAPVIVSDLTANGKVDQSFSYTIVSTTTNATTTTVYSVSIDDLPPGLTFSGSTISGTPTQSGTFEVQITASNGCGSDSEVLLVTIAQKDNNGGDHRPSVSLSALPQTIFKGQNSTLSWTSSNVTACSAPWTSATTTSGSFVVSPATTTTYEIACTGPNGNATSSTTVLVTTDGEGDELDVSLTANPQTLTIGQISTSTLTWTSTGATSCSALWTTATSTSGSQVVSPATTTTYSITCVDNSHSDTASTTITVLGAPQEPSCALPSIDSSLTPSGKVGVAFSYQLTGTTSVATTTTIQFNVSTTSLPAWLSYSTITNTFSGTPTAAGTFTIQVSATNTCGTDTENIVISIAPADTPSGGGDTPSGGGSSRSGERIRSVPLVLGTVASCDYLKDYLRIDFDNDPVEMIKLQVFLRELEGFKDLPITAVFDQQTFNAVAVFQERYFDDILKPWGHDKYTGYVYILTKKKVNEIVCERAFPLTESQENEIAQFKAFLESLKAQGVPSDQIPSYQEPTRSETGSILSPNGVGLIEGGIFGEGEDQSGAITTGTTSATSTALNRNLRNVAAAVFAGPQDWDESVNAVLVFLVILLALYLLSRSIVSSQAKKSDLSIDRQKIRKMFLFIVGLVLATIICLVLSYYEIVLPLLVLIIIMSVWLLSLSLGKKEVRAVLVPPGTPVHPKEMDKMFAKEVKNPPPLAPFTEPIEPPVNPNQSKRSDNFF